jgi:hypothetical protein
LTGRHRVVLTAPAGLAPGVLTGPAGSLVTGREEVW